MREPSTSPFALRSVRRTCGALLVIGLMLVGANVAGAVPQITFDEELVGVDTRAGDLLGTSIDLDGTTAIAGAPSEDAAGTDSGAAHVFAHNGTRWVEQAKLINWGVDPGDAFGGAVAVSGNTAVVGSEGNDDVASEAGLAYIFNRSGSTWNTNARIPLTPSDPLANDEYGSAVDIDGGTAVVGAPHKNGDASPGAVYVFTGSGTSWSQQQKLTGAAGVAGDLFGATVSLDGDTLLVGAPNAGTGGEAYVFTRSGVVWSQVATLTASDAAAGDAFGTDVAIDVASGTLVVGAPNDDHSSRTDPGSAYVFTGGGASWTEQTKLLKPADGAYPIANNHLFGSSVDVENGRIAVGAPYSYGFMATFEGAGATWTPYPVALTHTGRGSLGVADVAVEGDRLAMGAPGDWISGSFIGGTLQVWELAPGSSPFTYWDNGVSVTFSSITEPGYWDWPTVPTTDSFKATATFTSVNATPTGYTLVDRTLYDLQTNVTYGGNFTVTIPYNESFIPSPYNTGGPVTEADLKMLHWEGGAWVDVTSVVDTVNNTVSGVTNTMSEFVIAEVGTPSVDAYWDWDPTGANAGSLDTPHKDYRLTTQKCQVCHAVHNADPNGELLLPTTRANACTYCHITTSLGGIVVYGGDETIYTTENDFGHQTPEGASCPDCHAVHGANTIGGSYGYETKILHAGDYQSELVTFLAAGDADAITNGTPPPDWGGDWGPQDWYGDDVQLTAFCTRCHQHYTHYTTQTVQATGYTNHPLRGLYDPADPNNPDYPDLIGLDLEYAYVDTLGCSWCHQAAQMVSISAPGVYVQSFPHYNPGYDKFLVAAEYIGDWGSIPAKDSESDDVCIACHLWRVDPDEGVGGTY